MESPVAQAAQNPAFHDQHTGFDLGLVAWLARSRRQDADALMPGHLRIGPVDLRLVQARLDDRRPGVVRHHKPGYSAEGL